MRFRIGTKDVVWSYLANGLQVVVSLLTLPIVLRTLSSEEMGLWYAFQNIASFIIIFGNGFVPTIMRSVSYIFSGARQLLKEGVSRAPEWSGNDEEIDWALLRDVLGTCRAIYGIAAVVLGAVLASAGTVYIFSISKGVAASVTTPAWAIFLVSFTINVFYSYYPALLRGSGRIVASNKVIVYSKLVNLVTTYLFLSIGWGLVGVSASFFLSMVALRVFSVRYFGAQGVREKLRGAARGAHGGWKAMLGVLWHNSYRSGLVSLGAFFVTKSGIITASIFLGLGMTARLGLTQQVFGIVTALSTVVVGTYLPRFNQLEHEGDVAGTRRLFSKALVISIGLYGVGSALTIFGGDWILGLVGSKTQLLDRWALLFLAVILALETNHGIHAQLITARNEVPFVVPALVSGVLMVALSAALMKWTPIGVWGVLVAQFVCQAAYNNWKWPAVVMKRLQTHYGALLAEGLRELWGLGRARLGRALRRRAA